jgi:outer membrane protein assembly factor BamE (lipoprotein component of BamABCDE complex)
MKNFLKIFLLFVMISPLTSCVSRLEKHGYMFDMSDYQMVQDGVTSKERVSKLMGSPTLVASFDDDEVWIYYAEDVNHFLFFKPKIVERKILALRFNKSDVVSELRNIGLANEFREMNFATNHTEVDDHQRGLFKSFFGNIGQIKPQQ